MDLFRSLAVVESKKGHLLRTAPPRQAMAPPLVTGLEGAVRAASTVEASGGTEDSTVQRLSDLFEALPVGADAAPVPAGEEEDGWLLDVVRASAVGLEPTLPESEAEAVVEPPAPEEPVESPVSEKPKPPPAPEEPVESPVLARSKPPPEPVPPAKLEALPVPPARAEVDSTTGRGKLVPLALLALVLVGVAVIWLLDPSLLGLGTDPLATGPSAEVPGRLSGSVAEKSVPQPSQLPSTQRSASAPATTSSVVPSGVSGSATADPGAAPAASGDLPPVVDELGGDGSELLSFEGYLIVRSVAQAEVVVHGKPRGPTNKKLKTHCRQRNVRLRDPATGRWLTSGLAVRIVCMATTTVVINP